MIRISLSLEGQKIQKLIEAAGEAVKMSITVIVTNANTKKYIKDETKRLNFIAA